MARTALITGIRGQDGAYLAQFLLNKGYTVVGADRRSGETTHWRLRRLGIGSAARIVYCDLQEYSNVLRTLQDVQPDEIYNLAAQSFVPTSFDEPVHTAEITGIGVTRLLEALRHVAPEARFYQASTSEMFGHAAETPQRETTPFHPRSPYGVAKVYGHWITVNYREAYGMHASSGILFNHESPRRGLQFVTRKITHAVARIRAGLQDKLVLGNLEARRDWGYAGDYVEAMWLMLQQEQPDDYVIATGQTHTVQEFCELAFGHADLDWRQHVVSDQKLRRPAEVDLLLGDAGKAARQLGWRPKVDFSTLVKMMTDADLAAVEG